MAERITNAQFATAFNWATQEARNVGAIGATEWIGTAVAWSMSYVVVFDANGGMVRELSRPMPKRGLYEFANALTEAFAMVRRAQEARH